MADDDDDAANKVINFAERKRQRLPGENQPDAGVELPEFISPSTINELSDEQLESLLNLLRLRRLTSTLVYERTLEEKNQVQEERAREMLDKKCEQVWRELDRVLKNLDKLELRVNEMRALRIQAGLDW